MQHVWRPRVEHREIQVADEVDVYVHAVEEPYQEIAGVGQDLLQVDAHEEVKEEREEERDDTDRRVDRVLLLFGLLLGQVQFCLGGHRSLLVQLAQVLVDVFFVFEIGGLLHVVLCFWIPAPEDEDDEVIGPLVEPVLALQVQHHGHQGRDEAEQRILPAQRHVDQNEEHDGRLRLHLPHDFRELVLACLGEVLAVLDEEGIEGVSQVVHVLCQKAVARMVRFHSVSYQLDLRPRTTHFAVD